ncbi:MAG: hypothetical protein V4603_08550 [Pseudomonadota bacterium]
MPLVTGTIRLAVVKVGNIHYDAVLTRHPADPAQFVLTSALRLDASGLQPVATFDNNVLSIPSTRVNGTEYQIELKLVGSNPFVFKVTAATILSEDSADSPTAPQRRMAGYVALPNGRGGLNYEPVQIASDSGFDKARSLAAFKETLYPYFRSNTCVTCHNSDIGISTGAQAPLHADSNVELAHEYALTRVNFVDPITSKFVVRMGIDKHNCPRNDCAQAAIDMLAAVNAWKSRIADMLPQTPRTVAADVKITEAEVVEWIAQDKATLAAADKDFIVYTSMHELHNEGLTADELNIVRSALSKALNSVARWAPEIVNPQDVNGKGILYKFDMRNYWSWNKGVKRLLFGGSDDDLAFGRGKRDYRGVEVTSAVQSERYNYASTVSWDPEFSKTIWERVLHGNVEGAVQVGTIPPYINGFRGKRSRNAAGEYVAFTDFEWVETAQLIYTLTRPDVYNSIMMLPMYTDQLEDELGVIKSEGMDSYDYVTAFDAITVDSRLLWRANRKDGGWYWKTWDIFTGQLAGGDRSIFEVYREGGTDIRFPWWANPIPEFVDWRFNRKDTTTWSFVASLAEPFNTVPPGCDPQPNYSGIAGFYNCRHYTGTGGLQQSAEEMIWDLPNGLQGYMLAGAFNQRRVDAFTNIVRDPRVVPDAKDDIATKTGFTFTKANGRLGGFNDPRLNTGSSCIGCHIDGINRINNNLRDWLDESPAKLPAGPYGVDGWINDPDKVKRVRELYPPSTVIREYNEQARRTFLGAMAAIKRGMIHGADKNLYVEPVIWTVEYVQRKKYKYPQTTSN